jgi:hypothetical protein
MELKRDFNQIIYKDTSMSKKIFSTGKLGHYAILMFLILFIQVFPTEPLFAQFDESSFDIAGIKLTGSMYQADYKEGAPSESGFGYGAGIFLDRQLSGYFTLGFMVDYQYRRVDLTLTEEYKQTAQDLVLTNNQSLVSGSILLKFFPRASDFWIGLGPVGTKYAQPQGRRSDGGVAFALGYNFWITWQNKSDFDNENVMKVLVLAPEIRGVYNLTNLNKTKNQMEFLFYLGIATRAYRPGY